MLGSIVLFSSLEEDSGAPKSGIGDPTESFSMEIVLGILFFGRKHGIVMGNLAKTVPSAEKKK